MFKFPTPRAKTLSNAPSPLGEIKERPDMNLFQKLKKKKQPSFLKLLPKGKRDRWHSLEREGGRKNPESREIQGSSRERSPKRRRKTGSIAIIRCSCRQKKKLVLYWTWIWRGSKSDAFPKQEEFRTLRLERKLHVKSLFKMCWDFQRTKLFTQYQTGTGREKLQSSQVKTV